MVEALPLLILLGIGLLYSRRKKRKPKPHPGPVKPTPHKGQIPHKGHWKKHYGVSRAKLIYKGHGKVLFVGNGDAGALYTGKGNIYRVGASWRLWPTAGVDKEVLEKCLFNIDLYVDNKLVNHVTLNAWNTHYGIIPIAIEIPLEKGKHVVKAVLRTGGVCNKIIDIVEKEVTA